jgi:hypothetical protein
MEGIMDQEQGELGELLERQKIWDCMLRYARGMDRLDVALALSAYHAGAIEDHGPVIAPCEQFVPKVIAFHRETELATQHTLANHVCDIDGDIAHAETYVHCLSVLPSGRNRIGYGRFVDRLEKRDGRWGIVSRVSLPTGTIEADAVNVHEGATYLPGTLVRPSRDRSDPSYLRPLPISREPT